jgi:hypothetical protein
MVGYNQCQSSRGGACTGVWDPVAYSCLNCLPGLREVVQQ